MVPASAYCQNFVRSGTQLSSSAVVSDPQKKENLRNKLKEEWNQSKTVGDARLVLIPAHKDSKSSLKVGGAWVGGGGSGIACPVVGKSLSTIHHADMIHRKMDSESYDTIDSVGMLDLAFVKNTDLILPIKGELSVQYAQRILDLYFSKQLPFLNIKLKSLVVLINEQLQEQIQAHKLNPQIRVLDPLSDYGSNRYFEMRSKFLPCEMAQLATRYAHTSFFRVHEFFVDFDVSLILKMREKARSEIPGVVHEAALLLHEAIYLFASSLGHRDADRTIFDIVPFLLKQKNLEKLQSLSPEAASDFLNDQLRYFNLGSSAYVITPLTAEFMSQTKSRPGVSLQTFERYMQLSERTNDVYMRPMKTYYRSDEAVWLDALSYLTDIETRLGEKYGIYSGALYLIANEQNDELSFLAAVKRIPVSGFTQEEILFWNPRLEKAQAAACEILQSRFDRYNLQFKDPDVTSIYQAALRYCARQIRK